MGRATGGSTATVIGLGQMGSALARSLLDAGHNVTVWNRSTKRAASLADRGVTACTTPDDAIAASDVVIVCVRGYDAADEIFHDPNIEPLLNGKTIVQLGTGTPTEAAESAVWFSGHGARYLEGSIMNFPEQVGTATCQVLVSGDHAAFEQASHVLDAIGGDIRYLGADPTASAVINTAGLAFVYASSHAFLGASAMCDAAGAPIGLLTDVIAKFAGQLPALFGGFADMIEAGTYDSSSLRLASGADNLQAVVDYGKQAGVDTALYEQALRTFRTAAEADAGVNIAAAFEILRHSGD